jgi:ribosomal protein S18 acetylase RimI-like enzyme
VSVDIRFLGPQDLSVLDRCAEDVFDKPVSTRWAMEFLADGRHHIVVAVEGGEVVGMATGVHHVHPDKPPQFFINEVGVAPSHRGRGIARHLLDNLVRYAAALECSEAWVLTDHDNVAARRLYESAGATTPPAECIMYTFPIAGTDDIKNH